MATTTVSNLDRNREARGGFLGAMGQTWRRHRLAYGMLLPAIIAMVIVLFIPMLWGVLVSFRGYDKSTLSLPLWDVPFVALENYARAFRNMDAEFIHSTQVTISFVIITLILSVVFGLGAALVGNSKFRGQTIFRGIMLIPFILPGVVALTTFRFMFLNDGIINTVLSWLGIFEEPRFGSSAQTHFGQLSLPRSGCAFRFSF